MIQSRCRLSFTLEAGEGLGIGGDRAGQKLQSDETLQARVLRFNHAHAAATKFLNDLIMRNSPVES